MKIGELSGFSMWTSTSFFGFDFSSFCLFCFSSFAFLLSSPPAQDAGALPGLGQVCGGQGDR